MTYSQIDSLSKYHNATEILNSCATLGIDSLLIQDRSQLEAFFSAHIFTSCNDPIVAKNRIDWVRANLCCLSAEYRAEMVDHLEKIDEILGA